MREPTLVLKTLAHGVRPSPVREAGVARFVSVVAVAKRRSWFPYRVLRGSRKRVVVAPRHHLRTVLTRPGARVRLIV